MSVKLMGQVWELDLGHREQSVLLVMADHAHDDGTKCFPSVGRIAWKTGYSRRPVQEALASLRAAGLLVQVAEGGGRGRATEYTICLEAGRPKAPYTNSAESAPFPTETALSDAETALLDVRNSAPGSAPTVRTKGVTVKAARDGDGEFFADPPEAIMFILEVQRLCARCGVTSWPLKTQTLREWCREVVADTRYAGLDLADEARRCGEYWEPKLRRGQTKAPHLALRNWLVTAIEIAASRAARGGNGHGSGDAFFESELERMKELRATGERA